MTDLTIPAGPDEVTRQWLTRALRSTSVISSTNIAGRQLERLGEGQGFVGQIYRFTLEYDTPEDGSPRSLVVKLSSSDRGLRLLTFELNQTEVRFYQEIAPQVQLRTPHLYYSAADPDTSKTVLLLEDIAGARAGDNVAGGSTNEARLAVRQIAGFHAHWWESRGLQEITWLPSITGQRLLDQKTFRRRWAIFTDKLGSRIPPSLRQAAKGFGNHAGLVKDRILRLPRTVIHGDYRLDNLFFGHAGTGFPLTVFDWQLTRVGPGPTDVAYFMAWCLEPEHRRRVEAGLLKDYHDSLVENGVRGYGFDQCQRDYRLSMFYPLVLLVTSGALLDFTSDRGGSLIAALIKRVNAAVADHRIGELLPG